VDFVAAKNVVSSTWYPHKEIRKKKPGNPQMAKPITILIVH